MEFAELSQFPKGIVALLRGGEGNDTVREPFIRAEDGRLRVLADEGQLFEVVILHSH